MILLVTKYDKPNNTLRSIFPDNMKGKGPIVERKTNMEKTIKVRQRYNGLIRTLTVPGKIERITNYHVRTSSD